jgi:hypothetical protein
MGGGTITGEAPRPGPSAIPVEDFVWCTLCDEPHDYHNGFLSSEDTELACPAFPREHVDKLPKDWDKTYHAGYDYDFDEFEGYVLVPHNIPADPAVHRPMYYLEAEDD